MGPGFEPLRAYSKNRDTDLCLGFFFSIYLPVKTRLHTFPAAKLQHRNPLLQILRVLFDLPNNKKLAANLTANFCIVLYWEELKGEAESKIAVGRCRFVVVAIGGTAVTNVITISATSIDACYTRRRPLRAVIIVATAWHQRTCLHGCKSHHRKKFLHWK